MYRVGRIIHSICRDNTDMQYKIISQNLKNGKVINLYNNIPFIFNKIPSGEKKHEESTKEKREKIWGL